MMPRGCFQHDATRDDLFLAELAWVRPLPAGWLLPPPERIFARRGRLGWGPLACSKSPPPQPLPTARKSSREEEPPAAGLLAASCTRSVASLPAPLFAQAQTPRCPQPPRIIAMFDIAATAATRTDQAYSPSCFKPLESPFSAGAQSGLTRRRRLARPQDLIRARAYHREIRAGGTPRSPSRRNAASISSSWTRRPKHSGRWQPRARREVLLSMRRAPDDGCRPISLTAEIVHTLPSLAMTVRRPHATSGLAASWRDILVLQAAACRCRDHQGVRNSVKKFGARHHCNRRSSRLSREPEQNNPPCCHRRHPRL